MVEKCVDFDMNSKKIPVADPRPRSPDPRPGEGYPSPLPCGASRHSFDRLVFPTRNNFYNFEPPLAKFPGCATVHYSVNAALGS